MWFKQIQLYQLTLPIHSAANILAEKLSPFEFTPCLPSMHSSLGWVSPIEEEGATLARGLNGCIMICLQIEEKILPASVIVQKTKEKIKQIELAEGKKIGKKEKLSLKDEVTYTLLPRAFSKFTRVYAYIDTRYKWLILNCTSPAKTELFISFFKKTLGDGICAFEIIKPSTILTQWLKTNNCPKAFSIEKSCVLQDSAEQNRMVRCQQQNLFAESIQSLVKDGCDVIKIALSWEDKLNFMLTDDFTLTNLHLANDDLSEVYDQIESKQQKFDTDFMMMTEMLALLIVDLNKVFAKKEKLEERAVLALVG